MILERLREEPEYMSIKDYNMLAFDFRSDAGLVKSIIEKFGLFSFTQDGKRFYSEGFSKRMSHKDEKSKKAREAVQNKWGCDTNIQNRSERLSAARKKGTHTKEEWLELKDYFGCCVICGKLDGEVKIVKDHIIPIYQGGSDSIENLQPLCSSCNSRKGADNQDYRIDYCLQNAYKMPTKCLQNAYKMG